LTRIVQVKKKGVQRGGDFLNLGFRWGGKREEKGKRGHFGERAQGKKRLSFLRRK